MHNMLGTLGASYSDDDESLTCHSHHVRYLNFGRRWSDTVTAKNNLCLFKQNVDFRQFQSMLQLPIQTNTSILTRKVDVPYTHYAHQSLPPASKPPNNHTDPHPIPSPLRTQLNLTNQLPHAPPSNTKAPLSAVAHHLHSESTHPSCNGSAARTPHTYSRRLGLGLGTWWWGVGVTARSGVRR